MRWLPTLSMLVFCAPALADNVTLPDASRTELPNGTVVILNEKHEVPLVGFRVLLRGGSVTDPPEKAGLAALAAGMLEKGAGARDAAAFAEAIDSVGGRLSASGGLEAITIAGDFLARDAELMVELLADMLQRPMLDEQEFEKLRERMINLIRATKDSDPLDLLPVYANAWLFGDHPYAGPVTGSETSLAAITLADVRDYYQRHVGADRLIIVISGDFGLADMQAKLAEAFGDWRPAAEPLPEIPAPARAGDARLLLVDRPAATQTYFWLGNTGVARDFDQRAELELANTLFGGRFTSMLNTALRVESGLTYGARSSLQRPTRPGSVAITSFTRTDKTMEAIDMAIGVLGQLHDSNITPESIDSARNYVLGQFPTQFETAADLAAQFAELEFYRLPASYVDDYANALNAVTPGSVDAVIDTVYPLPGELVFVLIGDADAIREDLSRYGKVTEMPLSQPDFRPAVDPAEENRRRSPREQR